MGVYCCEQNSTNKYAQDDLYDFLEGPYERKNNNRYGNKGYALYLFQTDT
jgi:hypothetical protein